MTYVLTSRNDSYDVDYAVKGPDYIQGFKDGLKICEFTGVTDFNHYSFNSEFRLPGQEVNEMIEERDQLDRESDIALLDLSERVDQLEDLFERSLIDASSGKTLSTSRAYANQIKKGNISKETVPSNLVSEVEMFLRSL